MGTDVALTATSSVFEKLAMATGLPLIAVEVGVILLAMILLMIVLIMVFATLRIRKEIISLSFRVGYIAHLLKKEIEPPAEQTAPEEQEPEKEETFKEEWKL